MHDPMDVKGTSYVALRLAVAVDFLEDRRYVQKTSLELGRVCSVQFLLLHGARMGKEGYA